VTRRRPAVDAVDLAVGALAVARLTRLVTTDTLPIVARPREAWLRRWPAPGDEVAGARDAWIGNDGTATDGVATLPTGRQSPVHQQPVEDPPDSGQYESRWVWTEGHPLGELITCPWCASAYVATAAVTFAALAPRVWRPLSRVLAASMVAGLLAQIGE
jgi:hypothetical protein